MFALVSLSVCVGCAHDRATTETPSPDDEVSDLASLRRDNMALRRRLSVLEDRVLKLERYGAGSLEDDPYAQTRDLPVVKLEPETRSDAERPAHYGRPSSTSLPTPKSAQPVQATDDEYEAEASGSWEDEGGLAPVPESVSDAGVKTGDVKSYRLVGSRLVELTQTKAPKRPDRPARDAKGNAILAEYHAAMDQYKGGALVEAERAFERFARTYPRHDYADNALYWKGEAAYDQHHYSDALAAFTEVVERYGGGNKAPDALLKIGLCYQNLGDVENARDVMTQLIGAYPAARASDIARARLAELEV